MDLGETAPGQGVVRQVVVACWLVRHPHEPPTTTETIATTRLVLQPVTPAMARAITDGTLRGLRAAEGWPHADTADAMAMVAEPGAGPTWLITVEELVVGDCGAFSWPDDEGVVEIGYGVAEPHRRQGYATEATRAMCTWLFERAGARALIARVDLPNAPSMTVLERVGFLASTTDAARTTYRLDAPE